MLTRPADCQGCPLHEGVYAPNIAIGFMQPEGTGASGVLLLAEALGERDALDGLPIRPNGPAGAVLQGILRRLAGVSREQFLISSTIWCRPGPRNWLDGAPYEYGAVEHCQRHNASLVHTRRPRVIVTLGALPTRTVTGMAGYHQGIKMTRGFQLWSSRPEYMVDGQPIPVIPTYNPMFLQRGSKTRSRDGGKQDGGTGAKVEKAEGGMSLAGVMTRDIQLALQIAKTGPLVKPKYEVIQGNREVMDALIREAENNLDRPMAWDIETPRSIDMAADESEIDHVNGNVTQIQFALDRHRGFVFPGFEVDWVRDGTRKLLGMRRRLYTWNGWKFDNKVVSGQFGIPILGEDIDLMSAWHWVQPDLPQGLQYATSFYAPELGPWKHYARFTNHVDDQLTPEDQQTMDNYGTCDVISLHMNAEGIFKAMDARGLRTSYDRHVLKLRAEMVAASKRGFPVDPERHEAFGSKIGIKIGEINDSIQLLIPEAILGLEPKRKLKGNSVAEYGYVRTPKQILPWLDDQGNPKDGTDRVTIREEVPTGDADGSAGPEGEDDGDQDVSGLPSTQILSVVYVRRSVSVFNKETLENESLQRWCRLVPFSVGSPQQKIKYIEFKREEEILERMRKGQNRGMADRLAKYKVPKVRNKQKELKENAGAKELEKLFKSTEDPVFGFFVEIGKLKKMYGTYYKGWLKHGAAKGYVHTTFGLADTGTGQLSSVDPNIQNAPKHSDLAKEFRAAIRAKEGRVLVEIDKKSFHAQTLAFEAKDLAYARLAAIDVHSFMTAHRLKFPEAKDLLKWSDKDMLGWFKEKKKDEKTLYKSEAVPNYPDGLTFQQVRDYKSKRVILGIGFCQGALSIFEQNPEGYKNKAEVQTFLDLFGEIFDRVKLFQHDITQEAHNKTNLVSRWGYIRRFYDVFQWVPNKWNQKTGNMGDWGHGDDFEAAVAFLPANDAFGMFKEEMLRLAGYRLPQSVMKATFDEVWTAIKRGAFDTEAERAVAMNEVETYKKVLRLDWKQDEDLLEKYNFINQIHDSLIFHPFKSQVDELFSEVMPIMRQPCPTLYWDGMETKGVSAWTKDGLVVDAEAQVGEDWAHMEGVRV